MSMLSPILVGVVLGVVTGAVSWLIVRNEHNGWVRPLAFNFFAMFSALPAAIVAKLVLQTVSFTDALLCGAGYYIGVLPFFVLSVLGIPTARISTKRIKKNPN